MSEVVKFLFGAFYISPYLSRSGRDKDAAAAANLQICVGQEPIFVMAGK